MKPERYREIFTAFEETLLTEGAKNLPRVQIQAELDKYKTVQRRLHSDDECYRQLVAVVFYSGMRATTVTARLPTIYRHFPGFRQVLEYDKARVQEIHADQKMIRNRWKIQACLRNAEIFDELITEYGSFRKYIGPFGVSDSIEGVVALKEDLQARFHGLGPVTAYHLMSELGLPALKPDRVVLRIFSRLGLLQDSEQPLAGVTVGRSFAEATGHPIRYVDIVFVACGQVTAPHFGLDRGICLGKDPDCYRCFADKYCEYFAAHS